MSRPLNLLHDYYTRTRPNEEILSLSAGVERDVAYTDNRDDDLTVIINAYARPEYLPLIWEAVQYQTRRPRETWIVQNHPGSKAPVPRWFFERLRLGGHDDTRVILSDLNFGCWFRFLFAALHCRSRFVAIFDDDTLPGREALGTVLGELERQPGVYGSRGIVYRHRSGGPSFWDHRAEGWSGATAGTTPVDFVGHLWVMETYWLRDLLLHLPDRLLSARQPEREIGEDMYVSFVAQKRGLDTYVTAHPMPMTPRWTSLDGRVMGRHPNAVSNSPALDSGDDWLKYFVGQGWRLIDYPTS